MMFTVGRALVVVAVVPLLLAGAALRLAPLASERRTVAAISEDGYLMLTVARNVALGRSLTIAEGTIATNGVQPLVTFGWAGLHWLTGGERMPALRAVIVAQLIVALVTAGLVALLARDAFHGQPWRDSGALFAGSLWFASPLAVRHTTNGLETGPYACAIAAILLVDLHWRTRSVSRAAVLGLMLGVLFLIRNDAVFLIIAFLFAELGGLVPAPGGRGGAQTRERRLGQAAVLVAGALAVASPWLTYNARVFGHIVPVSGRAQNLNAQLGENLVALPRVLAEYAWMATPLPASFGESWPWALVTGIGLVAAVMLTLRRGRNAGLRVHRWMALLLVHTALLSSYYGVFFGAAYFLSRYLFPLSLVAVLLPSFWVMSGVTPFGRGALTDGKRGLLVAAMVTVLVLVSAARLFTRSAVQDHSQVVDWVSRNLTPETWVGAPQSGTLGYFHDRTINLDGKVNPLALRARRDNRLFHYVVDDTQIQYIVDWYGVARWIDRPDTVQEEQDVDLLNRMFEVLVRDAERNLVVLRRRDRPVRAPLTGLSAVGRNHPCYPLWQKSASGCLRFDTMDFSGYPRSVAFTVESGASASV